MKDLVSTVMWALINAEELGVTSANVEEMKASDNVVIKRLLVWKAALARKIWVYPWIS